MALNARNLGVIFGVSILGGLAAMALTETGANFGMDWRMYLPGPAAPGGA